MGMGTMGASQAGSWNREAQAANRISRCGRFFFGAFICAALAVHATAQAAKKWDIESAIEVGEILSDNVNLEADDEDVDLITEIAPRIRLSREGGRVRARLDYRMQNLIYADNSSLNTTNHQLASFGRLEMVENSFFLDGRATAQQVLVDPNGRISSDNIAGNSNRSDVYTYGFSPHWHPRFQGYADGEFRFAYTRSESDSNGASDSDILDYIARLNSGRGFGRLNWALSYDRHEDRRDSSDADDVTFQNSYANASYRVLDRLAVFGTVGHDDDDYESSNDVKTGSWWTAGVTWFPSRFLTVSAGGGENKLFSVEWNPTTRTGLRAILTDNDVGRNEGRTWNGVFHHRTRRTVWRATYSDERTTFQTLTVEQTPIVFSSPADLSDQINELVDEGRLGAGQFDALFFDDAGITILPLSTEADEVINRQRMNGLFQGRYGRSTLLMRIFAEDRDFELSRDQEEIYGANASWIWRFMPRTRSILAGSVYHSESDNVSGPDTETDHWQLSVQLQRDLTPKTTANVAVQRQEEDADNDDDDYTENRISMFIRHRF